jgi:hypothetical protein
MRNVKIYLAIAVLVLASLACNALTGDRDPSPSSSDGGPQPTEETSGTDSSNENDASVESDFPLTADAYNVTDIGDGSILFYTKLSAEEAMDFYRDEYTAMGYTERTILTVLTDGTFSMVFDGDPSGEAVVIQSVDLGDGSRTIAIRLEDV